MHTMAFAEWFIGHKRQIIINAVIAFILGGTKFIVVSFWVRNLMHRRAIGATLDGVLLSAAVYLILTVFYKRRQHVRELSNGIRGELYKITLSQHDNPNKCNVKIVNDSVRKITILLQSMMPSGE